MNPVDEASARRQQTAEASEAPVSETRWERIAANLKTIGGAVLLALIIRTVLFEAFEIEGPSMEPTLLHGDRVVVAKFLYGLFLPFQSEASFTWGKPDSGDVVIIKSPYDEVDIVKRVIGLPGDKIKIERGRVYRNGVALRQERLGPCETGQGAHMHLCEWHRCRVGDREFVISGAPMAQDQPELTVPEGHVYVLGDHRDSSNDSRSIGTIPLERLKGEALAIYWSRGPEGYRFDRMFEGVH